MNHAIHRDATPFWVRFLSCSSAKRSACLVRIAYNSCRNRHCPKCQGLARAVWLAERQAELLPVPYFHIVFTLPAPAAEIAFQNKATVYAILFKAAAETLNTIVAEPIGLVPRSPATSSSAWHDSS